MPEKAIKRNGPGRDSHPDTLSDYRERRDTRRSGEPAGRGRPARGNRGKPRFVVQQHDATSMHYDFRLEAGGVLKSWAVPKGPPLEAGEKRLAMPTEDHPLDYEGFEGVIPEGEYGAGPVIVWDTGIYENRTRDSSGRQVDVAEAVERGHVKVALNGRKLRGGYSLNRMGGSGRERWLLVKLAGEPPPGGRAPAPRPLAESVKSGRTIEQLVVKGGRGTGRAK